MTDGDKQSPRQIVQFQVYTLPAPVVGIAMWALCDDGSLWRKADISAQPGSEITQGNWTLCSPIPQDEVSNVSS